MIGSLVRFSGKKRELYFPRQSTYGLFDNEVGLVTSYNKNALGDEHVRVQWLKPVLQTDGRRATVSDFNLLNFEVVGNVKK